MKVLVTGSAGQLGFEVVRLLKARGVECWGTDIREFSITDPDAVKKAVLAFHPTDIVHCAAYTNVDKAESEPSVCATVNGMGTLNVARAARLVGARMVYISSDQVFSGRGKRPFKVNDPYDPKNVYGMSKVQGENAVRSILTEYFILRTSWLYGINGKNFVKDLLRNGREKAELQVVSDRVGSPTYAKDLSHVLCDLLLTDHYGIYHVRNEGFLSMADFAAMVMEKAGLPCRIVPILSKSVESPARRPLNSRLNADALFETGVAPMPTVEDALGRFLAEVRENS